MPRQARIDAPEALHHIIARGIERCTIFRNESDYTDFLRRLGLILVETKTTCFAWALIPNHFHLLLKTGNVPIATVMRRLLTGYASGFNRRHLRSGHLFQNRYKSILCQEDSYLKELVRYIHLNPLRSKLVKDMETLKGYHYSGHGVIMGKRKAEWQTIEPILGMFGTRMSSARKNYCEYVASGVELGNQPCLIGGGLIRSAGGWAEVQELRRLGSFQKSDERILGDCDFVESIMAEADENMSRRLAYRTKGITLDRLQQAVSAFVGITPEDLIGNAKTRTISRARMLICYWAVRELACTMTEVAKHLGIALTTVSVATQKGAEVVRREGLALDELLNVNI